MGVGKEEGSLNANNFKLLRSFPSKLFPVPTLTKCALRGKSFRFLVTGFRLQSRLPESGGGRVRSTWRREKSFRTKFGGDFVLCWTRPLLKVDVKINRRGKFMT